jgi:hypothetical protein
LRAEQLPPTPLQAEASLCIELLQLLLLAALLRQRLRLASGAPQQAPRPPPPATAAQVCLRAEPGALGSGLATGAVGLRRSGGRAAAAGRSSSRRRRRAAWSLSRRRQQQRRRRRRRSSLLAWQPKWRAAAWRRPLLEEALFRGLLLPCLCAALPPTAAVGGARAAFRARPPAPSGGWPCPAGPRTRWRPAGPAGPLQISWWMVVAAVAMVALIADWVGGGGCRRCGATRGDIVNDYSKYCCLNVHHW